MKMLSLALILALSFAGSPGLLALDNGLALTPPMGWLAWARFVCETDCTLYPDECIHERLFLDMATRLATDGFKQLGYRYVNIDDCWSEKSRHPGSGELQADAKRFPSGIRRLADQVHELGLHLGIYGDCGTHTCQNYPAQLKTNDSLADNYYTRDAQSFAEWQIDSFKFDGCYLNVKDAAHLCPPMGEALNATGRPMLFSCSWPAYENDEHLATNWTLVTERCNLWRAFGDIEDSWKSVLETIDYFVRQQELVLAYHGPGHWFDADQLIIGDFGLSHEQERAHMAIWCVWAAPLYMSNDLRSISKESSRLLRNKWAIAVNQDRLGIFGLMVHQYSYLQVFVKPIEPVKSGCPSYAIVYLDRRTLGFGKLASFKLSTLLASLHEKLAQLPKWASWLHCANRNVTFEVHDIFDNFNPIGNGLNLSTGSLELRVNPSGVRMVQLIQSN